MFYSFLVTCLSQSGFSRGDKLIPQIAAGPQGPITWSTVINLTNISSAISITNMRLAFFDKDGSPWVLQTNLGNASSFTLNLIPKQTLRVTAIGGASLATGYAVIYDEETSNSGYSEDYVLGISVFYKVLTDAGITETVSVPVREPTSAAAVPMEIDAPNLYSALAVVDASGRNNAVQLTLYSEDGSYYDTAGFDLLAGEQRTEFLDQNLFPGLQSFKGMAEITSIGPISLLSLLQARAADGNPQYTLLEPVDRESLRRNSYMILLQSAEDAYPFMPIDIDNLTVDFYRITGIEDPNRDPDVPTESYSLDLEYRYNAPDNTSRFLKPVNFAKIAKLDVYDDVQFDLISLPYLKALSTYSTNDIDVSNPDVNLTFAIRTDLGNYAKARIHRVINTTTGDLRTLKDLVLEVVVYK